MNWKTVKLGDVLEYEQPTKYIVESTDYNDQYETPVLTAGKSFLLGYSNEKEGIFNDVPVIIFDDFTTEMKFVDIPFKVKSSAMKILKAKKEKADIKYLFYRMSKIRINNSEHKRYWISKFSQQEIPLPPLETQQKITAILDKAQALCKLDRQIIQKYDQLAQSLFLDMFGDPVTNPKGWERIKLKKIASKIGSGATPTGGKESYKTEGISLIRSLNVHDNEFKYKDLALIDITQASKLNNVIVEENDVLFNITGASVCRCTIVPCDVLPARVNQHVAILRPKKEVLNSFYLCHALISKNCKIKLLGIGTQGGATREAITKEDLENFKLAIPAITLQTEYAERIKLIENQKQLAQQSLQKSEELFQSLLQSAFAGGFGG